MLNKRFGFVLVLAFGSRMLWLMSIGSSPALAYTSDSPSYIRPAYTLKTEGHFATKIDGQLIAEMYRTPGYPLFLIPFLSSESTVHTRLVQWVQILLNTASAALVYMATFAFWKDEKAAFVAGTFFALDVVNIIHCSFVLTDIVFVFLLSLALYGLVKKQMLLAGLVTTLAAFVRPIGLYYALFMTIVYCMMTLSQKDRSFKRLILFVMIVGLPLSGWFVRNRYASGRWTFSTLQDANLFIVRAALVEMEKQHLPYEDAVQFVQHAYATSSNEVQSSTWATQYLLTHWRIYTKVMAKDVVKLLSGNSMKVAAWMLLKDENYNPDTIPTHSTASPLAQAKELISRHSALGAVMIIYLVILGTAYILAVAGLWQASQSVGWKETLLLASPIVYFALITLGVDAQARYRLPIMPALFLFTGGGFKYFISKENV